MEKRCAQSCLVHVWDVELLHTNFWMFLKKFSSHASKPPLIVEPNGERERDAGDNRGGPRPCSMRIFSRVSWCIANTNWDHYLIELITIYIYKWNWSNSMQNLCSSLFPFTCDKNPAAHFFFHFKIIKILSIRRFDHTWLTGHNARQAYRSTRFKKSWYCRR